MSATSAVMVRVIRLREAAGYPVGPNTQAVLDRYDTDPAASKAEALATIRRMESRNAKVARRDA